MKKGTLDNEQRTADKGKGLWTVGRRARLFAFVLCPLSFVLPFSAQAESTSLTLNVGETSELFTRTYSDKDRWWKLATTGDEGIASATFVDANPEEPRMSATHLTEVKCFFKAIKPGTVEWTMYTYTDAPPYSSGKSYPAYSKADGQKGDWANTVGHTFTVTVVGGTEPPPTPPVDPTQISYTGDVEKKTDAGEEVYVFKSSGTLTLPADVVADILVVGGGGGGGPGGSSQAGTGGKGGTVVYRPNEILTAGVLNVVVGAGGSAGSGQGSGGTGKTSSFGTIEAAGGTGGARKGAKSGSNGSGAGQYDITGTPTDYGMGGGAGSGSAVGTEGTPNTGKGGQGGASGSKAGGKGGSGVVIVRILRERTKIAVPTAAQGLVWGITNQVGVAAGAGYVRGGICEASAIGEYTATVTPDDDHCWPDLTRDTKTIKWSIARRPAKVTVLPATKAPNADEPYFHTKNEGFLAADQAELVWTAWRTNTDETVGTYDVVILGEKEQSGYDITYLGGTLTIAEKPVGPKIVPVADIAEAIYGVEPGDIRIVSQTGVDITSAFALTGNATDGVTVALNREASVTFDLGGGKTETITVTPTLTETGDETVEPLEVGENAVSIGVKTIPGLTYELKRSAEPGTVSAGKVVDEKRAEGLRTKLTDPMEGGKPEKAFYAIKVRK